MNYPEDIANKVFLAGQIVTEPQFSHEIYGEGFYEMFIEVPRLSEQKDILPITVSERLLIDRPLKIGDMTALFGQFRSYNKLVDGKSRLMLTVFVRELVDWTDDCNPNIIELGGFICKQPIYRTTPFKREICDLLIAVNRAYNKSDYIPCIAWGRNARFVRNLRVGVKVIISGRIQSREYQKRLEDDTVVTKTAYEVSINKISVNPAETNTKAFFETIFYKNAVDATETKK
ncbi:MAG TPA: single-stranded DNA-binding protein [Clostridia bacterium]